MKNRILVLLIVVCASTAQASPRGSADGLWTEVPESSIQAGGGGARVIVPSVYRTVTLDLAAFRNRASEAPLEESGGAGTVITLPMPDGSFARFAIEESPIMDDALAMRYPDVKTYRAQGIDEPEATARLDITDAGFHGLVLSAEGTVYIDPYRKDDTQHYISYWRSDYERAASIEPFHCDVRRNGATAAGKKRATALTASGPTLRKYRLALSCTGEYTQFHGNHIGIATEAMFTTMNRVNGIYEREVGVRMVMVDNIKIMYQNPATDPFTNTDNDLQINQNNTDAQIGSANYDIGHLFGTGGGGVAYLGVVCENGWKAQGLTGSPSPVGDAFDVDYVAHEMGHQFGADHSFNGTTSNCGFGNRAPWDAYEPGSGSTIMAYAGICGASNLQPHSDAYFHGKSLDEIMAFITGFADSCAVKTSTGNSAPAVSAGPPIVIPASTPFYLTGSATDPNGDALTYCWEEFDLGTAAPPDTDNGNRPIFRSFTPAISPVRTFPRLADILSGVATYGESLPTTTRTMTFRLTARDNRAGGGGVDSATTTVSVISAAGPFVVTSPNSAVTLPGGTTQTVTWNVAGTTAPPVSCGAVKILLSTDGGNTFPTTLAASTANDGAEPVALPNINSSSARVRVECTTSPFFDISNTSFTLAQTITVAATATSPTSVSVTWNAVSGAASYEVFRRGATGGYAFLGTTSTTGYTDDTAAAGTAYLYALRSLDAAFNASPMSKPDLATTVFFTDPLLAPEGTLIKGVHITELRGAIGAVRTLAGLGAYAYNDPNVVAALPRAVHLSDLRAALGEALSALTLPAGAYTDPAPAAQSTLIKAAHLSELRNIIQ